MRLLCAFLSFPFHRVWYRAVTPLHLPPYYPNTSAPFSSCDYKLARLLRELLRFEQRVDVETVLRTNRATVLCRFWNPPYTKELLLVVAGLRSIVGEDTNVATKLAGSVCPN